MKLTDAVSKALEQRIEAINEEIRTLRDEQAELKDALGVPEKKTPTRSRPSPVRDAVEKAILENPEGLTTMEVASAADVNPGSAPSALKALLDLDVVKENEGRWYPVDAEIPQHPASELPPEERGGFNPDDVPLPEDPPEAPESTDAGTGLEQIQ